VSGIEEQVGNQVEIIRLDLLSAIGRQAARAYDVRMVPATLLFDSQGEIVDRQMGMPETDRVMAIFELSA